MSKAIIFNKGQGGLGRPLPGKDFVSALLFYCSTLPSGFDSSNRTKIVYSLEEAVALGITGLSSDETKAVAKIAIGGTPAAGNTMAITYAGIMGTVTVLGTYTLTSADATTTTTAAAALAAAINVGTTTHGFSATNTTSNLLITTKAGEGVFPNSGTPYVNVVTGGGMTGTTTQPTGSGSTVLGVASEFDLMHYHISEFFRAQPKGKLYVSIQATADATTFSKVTEIQNFAEGEIRQIGVYQKTSAFAAAQCTTLNAIILANDTANKPLSAIYQGDFSLVTDLTTLSSLHALTANKVSATFGQDGAGAGFKLYNAVGKSIGCLGLTLGAVAFAKVNENIGWIGKFDMNNGVEMNALAFANGNKLKSLNDAQIAAVDALGYIFLEKEIDSAGSFFNDSYTCITLNSDFAYIEDNRTIDKSIRNMRLNLLPALSSPITFNADGTISEDSVGYFETLCQSALDKMTRDGELSASKASIDPSQKVLSTGQLIIVVQEIPTGVARNIIINVGYTSAITN